jgi:2-C-methyl-D-erythritol 4-phosphate cytidylyltransferase
MSVAALVLAAGRGVRFGGAIPKAFVLLAGRPLLVHALSAMTATPAVDWVMPVVGASELAGLGAIESDLASIRGLLPPVVGGTERQDSMKAGLAALPPQVEFVAVHDAARPLVDPEAVSRVVAAARNSGAAILAVPARDTIKRVREGRVQETPDRSECYAAQTPQVFRVEILREALEKAEADGFLGTDDSQLVERLGVAVEVVPGDPHNIKVTDPADLRVAERWLRDLRESEKEGKA